MTLRSAQGRRLPRALAFRRGDSRGRDGGRPRTRPPWSGPPPRPRPAALPAPPGSRRAGRRGPATMRRLPWALLLPPQLVLLVVTRAPEAPVSAPRSLVWGPGLQAGVVLPVRYFYLQAVSSEGQNLTRSPPGSVQPRASLAPLPAPLRPRCASSPRPRLPGIRPSPAWRPSPGVLCRPSSGLVTSSCLHRPATKGGGSLNKSLLNE